MRILFIQKEGGIFGAEQYHLNILPALIKSGVDVEFLRLYTNYQLGKDSNFVKRLQQLGIKVYQVNIGRFPGPFDLFKTFDIIRKGQYDIIHSHLIHADLYAALVKTLFNVKGKFVSTKHGYDNSFTAQYGFDASKQKKTVYYLISRWSEQKFDKTCTISKGLLNFFKEIGLTTGNRMELIYYGFDLPEIEDSHPGEEYKLARYQICIAGRLVEFKGHRWAIEAMTYLSNKFPGIKLVVVGSGKFEGELRNLVRKARLEDNVIFLGYRNDVSLWMHYSDVVVVPSRSEGFGVVFLEAFNARTPVVAFDVPAANELIEHEHTGLLAKSYDSEDLACKIESLLNNSDQRDRLVNASLRRAQEHFSLETMVKNTISFYNRVLVQ